jgi:hypothetical protein
VLLYSLATFLYEQLFILVWSSHFSTPKRSYTRNFGEHSSSSHNSMKPENVVSDAEYVYSMAGH